MVKLTLDASGISYDDLMERVSDLSTPIGQILTEVLSDARVAVGETKSEPGGPPWPAMAKATVAGGRDPSTLLVDSGRLLESLEKGAAENIFEAGKTEGATGSSARHADFQQTGQQAHPMRPPRPFLEWSDERIGVGPELGGTALEAFERHILGK